MELTRQGAEGVSEGGFSLVKCRTVSEGRRPCRSRVLQEKSYKGRQYSGGVVSDKSA